MKTADTRSTKLHRHLHDAGTRADCLPDSLVDESVEETFPASDPPALGSTRLVPDDVRREATARTRSRSNKRGKQR